MKNKLQNKLAGLLAVLVCFFAFSGDLLAQATSVTTLTDGIADMVADGGTVGIAALAIFVAAMAIRIIKKFARAGA